mmetsp:Transcript_21839/g.34726  ORF Transcript_21839/g.34726 Transcript_21839/m.34726 type:complete len:122 (-) Transcript_21839:95-460(-)
MNKPSTAMPATMTTTKSATMLSRPPPCLPKGELRITLESKSQQYLQNPPSSVRHNAKKENNPKRAIPVKRTSLDRIDFHTNKDANTVDAPRQNANAQAVTNIVIPGSFSIPAASTRRMLYR